MRRRCGRFPRGHGSERLRTGTVTIITMITVPIPIIMVTIIISASTLTVMGTPTITVRRITRRSARKGRAAMSSFVPRAGCPVT